MPQHRHYLFIALLPEWICLFWFPSLAQRKATEKNKTHKTVTLIQNTHLYCVIREHNMVLLLSYQDSSVSLSQRGQLPLTLRVWQISSCQVGAEKRTRACLEARRPTGKKATGDLFNHLKLGLPSMFNCSYNLHVRISTFRQSRYSGRLSRSKRTRKLCSGTLYRKPSSAPPRCGIVLLPLSTKSSPSTHRGFLNPGCAILP